MGGRVLMVSFHYPPSGGVAAHRPARFAQYLPDFGWEPVVVAREPDPRQPRDESFARVPAPLHRLAPFEPSRALGLLPASWVDPLRRFLCIPDEEGGWRRSLRGLLPRLIREQKPAVVWANSVPPGTLVAAAEAARSAGIPFVADFHNEWTRNMYHRPSTRWHDARHRSLERFVVESARRVVTLNPLHTEDLQARFPSVPCETIENGFDPADFGGPAADPLRRPLVFTYAGSVYGYQSPRPFLEALSASGLKDVEVRVVGDRFGQFEAGTWPFPVRVERHLPHGDLGAVLSASAACFLCLEAPAARQLPAKLYEYLGAGRPVFGIVPRGGAADRWIRGAGAGTSVPSEEREAWPAALRDFIAALPAWKAPASASFQRRAQAAQLARVLDEVSR